MRSSTKRSHCTAFSIATALAVTLLLSVTQQTKAATGTDHGFFWQLYQVGGSASISFPQAGTYAGNFQINYSNVTDVVGGKGWNPGSARVVNYNIGSLTGSYNFVGVY